VQVGNIIYVGGNFTEVHENGGEGPGVLARKNLAAFDATTGAPTAWAPSANGEVGVQAVSSFRARSLSQAPASRGNPRGGGHPAVGGDRRLD
jgi:hypothetical protein